MATDYGFGTPPSWNTDVGGGQKADTTPSPGLVNSNLPQQFTAPYYNAAGVAGNVGTMLGQVAPGAQSFLQGLFSPTLNSFEQAYLGAGLGNALTTQEQGFNRQEAQFENTPFHSGLTQAQGDVMNQTSRDALSTAGQMGMQRQQLANQQAQYPFQGALQAAMVGPSMAEREFNLANTAFSTPYNLPMSVWSGIPVPSPAVITGQGSSSGGKSII